MESGFNSRAGYDGTKTVTPLIYHNYYKEFLPFSKFCSSILLSRLFSCFYVENKYKTRFIYIVGSALIWTDFSQFFYCAFKSLYILFRYSESRQNFLYSCDGSGCGKMLIEYHKDRGYSSEVDVFIGLDFAF